MTDKHPTIGVMITEDDRDLAVWFNMMRGHNASKWISGMLAAWDMGETLDAGGCPPPAAPVQVQKPTHAATLLFGSGQAGTGNKRNYGWTVKGPNGEYIVGSVINVSIARREIRPIIDRLRREGRQLAPFVKSLIRSSITTEERQRLPDINALNAVFARYRLKGQGRGEGVKLKPHTEKTTG